MDDLNIRAAKALGWVLIEEIWCVDEEGKLFPYATDPYGLVVVRTEDLKFDSSYDWAYLLMKECYKRGLHKEAHIQLSKNAEMEWAFTGNKDKPIQPTVAEPEEISLACVEVLEKI